MHVLTSVSCVVCIDLLFAPEKRYSYITNDLFPSYSFNHTISFKNLTQFPTRFHLKGSKPTLLGIVGLYSFQ